MDKILFLLYCFSNAVLYSLVKYIHVLDKKVSTIEVMGYLNCVSLLIMAPYAIYQWRKIVRYFPQNIKLSISAPASMLKIYSIQFVSPANAMVVSFLIPSIVTILSFITLNEFEKQNIKKYLWILVSFIGVAIFVGPTFKDYSFIYALLLLHVLMKGLINVFLKQLSTDRYVALFYNIFYYCIFALCTFVWYGKFDPMMMLNWKIIGISILSVICQLALIKSYTMAAKISLLQNLDYSRMIFTCIVAYPLFGDIPNSNQVAGIMIIIGSIFFSQINKVETRHLLTLGLSDRINQYQRYRKKLRITKQRQDRKKDINRHPAP